MKARIPSVRTLPIALGCGNDGTSLVVTLFIDPMCLAVLFALSADYQRIIFTSVLAVIYHHEWWMWSYRSDSWKHGFSIVQEGPVISQRNSRYIYRLVSPRCRRNLDESGSRCFLFIILRASLAVISLLISNRHLGNYCLNLLDDYYIIVL